MRAVKSQDTKPELIVRRLVHGLGYRFRLHRRELPGKPDLVLPKYRTVIFVNGCFWHAHDCKRGARLPKANAAYWQTKIARNVDRDRQNLLLLRESGWTPVVIWECELKDLVRLRKRVLRSLKERTLE